MSWEQITTWIDHFTNKPLVYGIFIVLVSFACAFILFSQTSIGKKALRKLTSLYTLGDQRNSTTLKKVEEVERLATERIEALESHYEQKASELKAEYEQKVATLVSIVNFYVESLFESLELVPNAKVQNQIKVLKANYETKKNEIAQVIGPIYQDYTSALEKQKDEIRKEYDEKVAFLESEIAQLSLYINEIKESKEEEPSDGEREETTNSNPEEKTLQDVIESM